MNESILVTIKKMLGLDADYSAFDTDVIVAINAALSIMTQVGVGPAKGFYISGYEETWGDLIGQPANLEAVKLYVYFRTKLAFDPPSGSVADAMSRQADELLWRVNVTADSEASTE